MHALTATRTLVDGEWHRDAVVVLDGPLIDSVRDHVPAAATHVPLTGCDLIPGLVDLHSDCLDETMHPRPSARIGLDEALVELDTQLAAHGITTHFLCVSLETETGSKRSFTRALETLRGLGALRNGLRVDHRVHLRVDVCAEDIQQAAELHDAGVIGLMSYMDHTPGQGQYPDVDGWMRAFTALAGPDAPPAEEILAAKLARADVAEGNRQVVAEIARDRGTTLASHDDDSPERVSQAVDLGVRISEFPVTPAALDAAAEAGLGTVMGAPNARRGQSHSGNLSARDAIATGRLDALASDYHPASMLVAAYLLAREGLCADAAAIELVTSGPARIAGLVDRGRIAPGCRADLVAVQHRDQRHPTVRQTWVGGAGLFGRSP